MGVTSIIAVQNHTEGEIIITNRERSSDTPGGTHVGPLKTIPLPTIWIPWCGNSADFAYHSIQIDYPGWLVTGYIWQCEQSDGDHVRWGLRFSNSGGANPRCLAC